MRKQWQLLLVQTESSSIPSSRIARCEARTMSAPDGKDGISNQFSEGVGGRELLVGDDRLGELSSTSFPGRDRSMASSD